MKKTKLLWIPIVAAVICAMPFPALADQTSATIQALRMAGMITGGSMPASAPEFATMVTDIQAGNYVGAAQVAVNSAYFPSYLPRRMAKQMMNTHLSEIGVSDNDATLFIVANLIGSGTTASISKLWSQNTTYMINPAASPSPSPTHIGTMSSAQINAINWRTDIVAQAGQTAIYDTNTKDSSGNEIFSPITIPSQHVGGYMTLNNVDPTGNGAALDNSFAQNGLLNGTNLRAIEGMYETTLGVSLAQMVVTTGATAQVAPRFVPQLNPSFSVGQNQPACLSCHGGGASNLTHGYAAFADKFDFDTGFGLIYIPNPTTSTMKSLGSNPDLRQDVLTCNLSLNPPPSCDSLSQGASTTQAWDLTTWQQGGLLTQWQWNGAVTGNGLNALGTALGKAGQVYGYLTQRVINEICPLGAFTPTQLATIASGAAASDNFGYIVTQVASDPSCL